MSWSHQFIGPAKDAARSIEVSAAEVDTYMARAAAANAEQRSGIEAERALHSRAVAMLVVACHETKEHHVAIEAHGHFDGKHQHVTVKFDGVNAPVAGDPVKEESQSVKEPSAPAPAAPGVTLVAACVKCKPNKPCREHKPPK